MGKFDANKCKTNLKLAVHRIKLQRNKKSNLNQKLQREIAELLRNDKTELARVKVEAIIREDMLVQSLEILELFIELLHARMGMLKMQKTVPYDLREAVCTIIYAAPRVDIKELHVARKLLIDKYGKNFGQDAMENRGNCVNPKIVHKLSACAPENYLVFEYLGNIAKKYNVDWDSPYQQQPLIDHNPNMPTSIHQPMQPSSYSMSINQQQQQQQQNNFLPQQVHQKYIPQGGHAVLPGANYNPSFQSQQNQTNHDNLFPSVPSNNGNNASNLFPSVPSNNDTTPPPYTPNGNSNVNFPTVPGNNANNNNFDFPSTPDSGNNANSDFDDLTARFNRLKKK